MKVNLAIMFFLFWGSTTTAQVFDNIPYYKKFPAHQLHQDLDYLLKKFDQIHPNYFRDTPRDTVIMRYDKLKSMILKPMTRLDFMNLLSPVVFNVIKDGHNYVYGTEEETKQYTERGGKYFPFPVKIREARLYINSNKTDIPFNSEIIAINKVSARQIIEKILNGYSGESDKLEESLFSNWFNSAYWSWYGGFSEYEIQYRDSKDNSKKNTVLDGKSQAEIDALRMFTNNSNYSFSEIAELETGVITYNACEDLKNFRPFCDSTFTIMKTKGYKNLVIDIRENVGGTTRLNDILFEYITNKPVTQFERVETKVSKDKKKDFILRNREYSGWFKWYHYLWYPIYIRKNAMRKEMMTSKNGTFLTQNFEPRKPTDNHLRFEGKIYLLIGNKTYSSAACFAAALKCYNIATIVGQETGGPTCFTADWVGVQLPNTKLKCAISSKRLLLACGKCDGKGVIPDYNIPDADSNKEFEDLELNFVKNRIALNK